jgi:hypothetical protein
MERTIEVQAFTFGVDNKPTCCSNIRTKETCVFLQSRKFGSTMVCALQPERFLDSYAEYGHLKPLDACIIWAKKE